MRLIYLIGFLFFFSVRCFSQDFMIQSWYWDYPKTCDGNNWAQTLQGQVNALQQGGFTYVWLPPLSRASFGSCSNGYDPKDLYDLGEYGQGATGVGTRTDVDNLITALTSANINSVADIVLNHRDGGVAENNSAVKNYITNHYTANKAPFPSDRYRCILPLGGGSGNNAGDYYFKISSKTADPGFFNKEYKVYLETDVKQWQGLTDQMESEPNGGGDCGEANNTISLGRNWFANIDVAGCLTDEFHLNLSSMDFNAAGDFLYIYLTNTNNQYSDHRIYGIWNGGAGADVVNQMEYQTYTDFSSMPSGQGSMNFQHFKPNTSNAATTWLSGDWDGLWFFYDYDQSAVITQDVLNTWVKWLWTDVNIRGYRMDAVKHFDYVYTGDMLDYLHGQGIDPGMVVGEFFDTNAGSLKGWIDNVEANMDPATKSAMDIRVFDFSLRSALKEACDNGGYDVRHVFNSGMVDAGGASAFNVVTFLNNHDYRDGGQPVQNDPVLGYAYLLSNNHLGLPSIFYPEYFGVAVPHYPTVNLHTEIDELIAAHKNYIFGSTHREYLSRFSTPFTNSYSSGGADKTMFFQLHGGVAGKDVLVCINFSSSALNMTHQINSDVENDGTDNFPMGQTFSQIVGNSSTPTLTTNGTYEVNIQLPAKSYSIWVQGAVLPLELKYFLVKNEEDEILLNWESALETNFDGFNIEKSFDGVIFEKIGFVKGEAKNGENFQYEFIDRDLSFNTTLYYRLKMLDKDGSFQYSDIKTAKIKKNVQGLTIKPNPSSKNTNVSFETLTQQEFEIEIFDNLGHSMYQKSGLSELGQNSILLPTESLSKGIYGIKISFNNSESFFERFLKITH